MVIEIKPTVERSLVDAYGNLIASVDDDAESVVDIEIEHGSNGMLTVNGTEHMRLTYASISTFGPEHDSVLCLRFLKRMDETFVRMCVTVTHPSDAVLAEMFWFLGLDRFCDLER